MFLGVHRRDHRGQRMRFVSSPIGPDGEADRRAASLDRVGLPRAVGRSSAAVDSIEQRHVVMPVADRTGLTGRSGA
jgi:hypothetical protein